MAMEVVASIMAARSGHSSAGDDRDSTRGHAVTTTNVIVTLHSAGTTWDTWFRRADFSYANIKRVREGQRPLSVPRE